LTDRSTWIDLQASIADREAMWERIAAAAVFKPTRPTQKFRLRGIFDIATIAAAQAITINSKQQWQVDTECGLI
jgi:hypothetical protein